MKKTKCTKMVSLGIAMMILLSLFSLPSLAESNLVDFVNPEFDISTHEGKKRVEGWTFYGDATIDEILSPNDPAYLENPNADGNVFHSTKNGHGLITSNFLPLNSDKKALISLWYKSTLKNVLRIVVESYNDTNSDPVEVSAPEYLPSTNDAWKQHKYVFSTESDVTKVKVIIRVVDFTEKKPVEQEDGSIVNEWVVTSPVSDANVHFMSPSYSLEIPVIHVIGGDFESNTEVADYSNITSVDTNGKNFMTIETEQNGNQYILIDAKNYTDKAQIRFQMTTIDLKASTTYKVSFKAKGNSPTNGGRLDLYIYKDRTMLLEKKKLITSTIGNLGSFNADTWTEYVGYFSTTEEENGVGRIQIWTDKGYWSAIDDIIVEEAKNNAMIYQNGVETTVLSPGAFSARYHNISDKNNTFIVALYKLNSDGRKILDKIEITTANANMTLAGDDAVIDTITIPNDGASYQIKAFALDGFDSLKPSMKAKTAKTVSNTAA